MDFECTEEDASFNSYDESDGEEVMFDEDDLGFTRPSLSRQQSFEVLIEDQIQKEVSSFTSSVCEFLSLPQDAAVTLLRHNKWNKEKLIDSYTDNQQKCCKNAGIPTSMTLIKQPKNPKKKIVCPICYEDVRCSRTLALGCKHRYCAECWKNYLEVKIKGGANCTATKCMNPKCKLTVHPGLFRMVVSPEMLKIYNRFVLRSFVEESRRIKWCPFPGCTNCVRIDRTSRKEAVVCLCGFRFCFGCSDSSIGDHMPADCVQVEKWLQKASDESENVKWLVANTKKCPQCRSPIEKSGGCMHMTCNKNAGGCGFEFCWLCRGSWKEHGAATGGFYNCNKYEKSDAKKDDDEAKNAKTDLETYMFYYHRYESHRNAGRVADKQRKEAAAKAIDIQNHFEVRSADSKFLMEATEQLINCRRVLQWSYAFGYYFDKDIETEKNLYEYLQEELEKHTNHLSELYETPLEKIKGYKGFCDWKQDVTNYTRVTQKFLKNFTEGVAAGLTTD